MTHRLSQIAIAAAFACVTASTPFVATFAFTTSAEARNYQNPRFPGSRFLSKRSYANAARRQAAEAEKLYGQAQRTQAAQADSMKKQQDARDTVVRVIEAQKNSTTPRK